MASGLMTAWFPHQASLPQAIPAPTLTSPTCWPWLTLLGESGKRASHLTQVPLTACVFLERSSWVGWTVLPSTLLPPTTFPLLTWNLSSPDSLEALLFIHSLTQYTEHHWYSTHGAGGHGDESDRGLSHPRSSQFSREVSRQRDRYKIRQEMLVCSLRQASRHQDGGPRRWCQPS